jgi:hypothetical protein
VFDRVPHAFLLTPGAVNIVAMCMTDAVSTDAFALMEKISRYSTAAVYDALRHYQRSYGTNFRFGLLVAAFDSDQGDAQLRELSFRIVNRLVSEVDDMEERFDLRNEIMRAGMSEVMSEATSAVVSGLAQLVREFEALADADFGAMIAQFGQDAVMERLETFMAEADDLGDDLLRCSVMCGGELRGTCTVPYTAATTGREVRDTLLAKFPIVEPTWRRRHRAAAGAGAGAGVGGVAESSTCARRHAAQARREEESLDVVDAAGRLMAPMYDVLNEKMYGLYVHAKQKQKSGFWLDLSKPLAEYPRRSRARSRPSSA